MPQFLDRDNPTLSVLQRVRLTRCRMRSEFVGWLVKVLRELRHDPDVGFFGTMGVITTLEFSSISWVVGSQGPPFLRPNLLQPPPTANPRTRGSVRRASGFVQIAITLIGSTSANVVSPSICCRHFGIHRDGGESRRHFRYIPEDLLRSSANILLIRECGGASVQFHQT